MRFLNDDATIIILSNFEGAPVDQLSRDLAAVLFDQDYQIPKPKKAIVLAPKVLAKYVGRYQLAPEFYLTIRREGSRLIAQATGQQSFEILARSKTDFFVRSLDAHFTFIITDDGEVSGLILHQIGKISLEPKLNKFLQEPTEITRIIVGNRIKNKSFSFRAG